MAWRKECLDVALVRSGLLIMFGYHLYLLYRCLKFPQTTILGYGNHRKSAWVEKMLQVEAKYRGLSVTVMNDTISASTFFGFAFSDWSMNWLVFKNIFRNILIYDDRSSRVVSIKYIRFLMAFGSFLQCVRCIVHANFLVSLPNTDIPVNYVQRVAIRGSLFLSIGLQAIYFATLDIWSNTDVCCLNYYSDGSAYTYSAPVWTSQES